MVRPLARTSGLPHVWKPVSERPPLIMLSARSALVIRRETAAVTDGCETGGILLGTVKPVIATVRHAGAPGPGAVRTPTSFLRDRQFAQRFADACWAADRSEWIGEWHSHPGMAPIPSSQDISTYRSLLTDTELGFDALVSLIVTDTPTGLVLAGWWCDRAGVHPATVLIEEGDT